MEEAGPSTPKSDHPSLAWLKTGRTLTRGGPSQILKTEASCTWDPRGAVRILPGEGRMENLPPMSVPDLLMETEYQAPDAVALKVKRDGVWQRWTYKEYLNDIRAAAKGFIALGLQRYHSVCILGFNSPEWFISDFAAIFAGGLAAGIYITNSSEACAYCAIDSKANIFVVEDEKQLAKILEVRHKLPDLKAIIQYTGKPTEPGVLSWEKLMTLGNQQKDDKMEDRLRMLAVNTCCTLIYTSGTTGNPKGVMLSHDNLTFAARVFQEWAGYKRRTKKFQEEIVSYLPLSHIAAHLVDMYSPVTVFGAVTFADRNAIKGTLVDNLKEVRPTKFLGVPRVWEKMHDKLKEAGRSSSGLRKSLMSWAVNKSTEHNTDKINGYESTECCGFCLAKSLVLNKVHKSLGLNRCDLCMSGAAPLSLEILEFFMGLDILVCEAYGMSECTGPHSMVNDAGMRLGSVGRTMAGCRTKILNPDKDGNGEVLMRGRHVFMGYLNQEEKTKAALDEEGWLHSEDIGRVDNDGFLFITGRLKELLITAGGENVAPVPIEDAVKADLPIVSQAVLIGDKLRFISILLTLKTEVDPNTTAPLDKLTPMCKEWIEKNGSCSAETLSDVLTEIYKKKNKKLIDAIQSGIELANARATSRAQLIKKWVILSKDFSLPGGELGPTMKLKRNVVLERYKDKIAEMYATDES